MILITKVKKDFGWMNNMSHHPIVYLGKTYPTAEHLFQSLRFDNDSDKYKIRIAPHGGAAKKVAYSLKKRMQNATNSVVNEALMTACIMLKMDQHPELKNLLIETGNQVIREDVTKRSQLGNMSKSHLFWGSALVQGQHWVGVNMLGKIYMKLRIYYQTIKEGVNLNGAFEELYIQSILWDAQNQRKLREEFSNFIGAKYLNGKQIIFTKGAYLEHRENYNSRFTKVSRIATTLDKLIEFIIDKKLIHVALSDVVLTTNAIGSNLQTETFTITPNNHINIDIHAE